MRIDEAYLVSIIMPAYNAGEYIQEAIESVLNQTHIHWQLLIINDGSKDNTEQIVQTYQDTRIQYFKQSNKGVSAARNVGLSNMQGGFFCFLDADDRMPQDSIRSRIEKFVSYPGLQFVDGQVKIFDAEFKQLLSTYTPQFRGWPLKQLFTLNDNCFFSPTWMVKRINKEIFMLPGLTHGEDLLFYMELSRCGGLYDFVDEEVLHYRKHSSSAMQNLDGLNKGYRQIYTSVNKWPEFSFLYKVIYQFKTRKIMFLSYLTIRHYKKAFLALIS